MAKRNGSAQGQDDTGGDFANSAADDAAAEAGMAELDAMESDEGDSLDEGEGESQELEGEEEFEDAEESDLDEEDEEQSEDQDDVLDEEEEEGQPDDAVPAAFKDKATGNLNWKAINGKLGGAFLQKAFKESQKAVTRAFAEKKEISDQLEGLGDIEAVRQQSSHFQHFDQLYRSNPKVFAAVNEALGLSQGTGEAENNELPPGVHPDDPVFRALKQQERVISQLVNQSRQQQTQVQQQQRQMQFRQGLESGVAEFQELAGRNPTEPEIRKIAAKMRETGHLAGDTFVMKLFRNEIQQAIQERTRREFRKQAKEKRKLPSNPKSGSRPSKTSKRPSRTEGFEEAWEESMKRG